MQTRTGVGAVEQELARANPDGESIRDGEARAESPSADTVWTEQTLKGHADELFGMAFFADDEVDDDETTHPRASQPMPSAHVAGNTEALTTGVSRFAE